MKRLITCAIMLSVTFSLSHAQSETFFERINTIKNLYKTSPKELCSILDVSYEPVPVITADQLKEELNTNTLLVINVLTKNYYDDCHIQGSINVPLPTLVDHAKSWNKSQKIVVYCALDECDAGEKGCILLRCMGFENVLDYRGGIKEWYQLAYPTEGPAISEYLHWKSISADGFELYPQTIVCSRQMRWINRYQS